VATDSAAVSSRDRLIETSALRWGTSSLITAATCFPQQHSRDDGSAATFAKVSRDRHDGKATLQAGTERADGSTLGSGSRPSVARAVGLHRGGSVTRAFAEQHASKVGAAMSSDLRG